jgi:hypothetical protein
MISEPASSTLITETDSETETIPKPCSAHTDDPVYKRKQTPLIQTLFPLGNTTRKKQRIIHDFYGPNSWYNTPATTHNYQSLTTKESQTPSLALNNSLSTAMSFNLFTTMNTSRLRPHSWPPPPFPYPQPPLLWRTHFFWIGREPFNLPTNQPLNGIHHSKYREIEAKIQMVTRYTHGTVALVLINLTLQNHQANNRAAFVDLTTSDPEPKPATTSPAEGEIILPSPYVKQESPLKPVDASTLAKAAINPLAPVHTYKWYPKPTAKINTHIHDNSFLKTISTEYPEGGFPLTVTFS